MALAESLNWWTDVVVPLGSALIGGGLAILGGFLAARYEASRTRELALQLRAREREEQAALRLAKVTTEIADRMRMWRESLHSGDSNRQQPASEAGERQAKLRVLWQEELSWLIDDEAIEVQVGYLLHTLETVAEHGLTDADQVDAAHRAAWDLAVTLQQKLGKLPS